MALFRSTRLLSALGSSLRVAGTRAASNDVNTFRDTYTMRMYNGEKQPTGLFSAGEIEARVRKLRDFMEEEGVAACLFTSIHNVNYYTGKALLGRRSFGITFRIRPYGLLITPEKHVTISALIDAGQPWRRSPHDNIIFTDWKRDNYFRAVVEELGGTKGSIGIEYDHMTLERSHKLQTNLPHNNTLVDVSAATMRMRMKKSLEEVAVIKNSTATADIGGWACVEALGEGVPEYEVALAGTQAMVRNIAKLYQIANSWIPGFGSSLA
ncbi:hypothetical protein C7M84_005727 [Penaeus vannamei]|uniref:Creatinase N-terminal domain-containing protein n=1 Tax=Penaeus vannamei TaxID=6689 RepID=A0A423TGY5_PENVA|nr:hypothetical protein C7M84_005727 [Penaeus vannamei]